MLFCGRRYVLVVLPLLNETKSLLALGETTQITIRRLTAATRLINAEVNNSRNTHFGVGGQPPPQVLQQQQQQQQQSQQQQQLSQIEKDDKETAELRSLLDLLDPAYRQPMTVVERIRNFTAGIKKLFQDYQTYKNIHDASRTPLNAWTVDHPYRTQLGGGGDGNYLSGPASEEQYPSSSTLTHTPGRIPRRQYEQQRRIKSDGLALLPVVVLSMVPIIGYIPMILAVSAPRQFLSRHFYNLYEIYLYTELEYQQRQRHFEPACRLFGQRVVDFDLFDPNVVLPDMGSDDAGPILDPVTLFQPLLTTDGSFVHNFPHLETFRKAHLIELAAAVGIHQQFPPKLSTQLCGLMPKRLLRLQIRQKMQVVINDDMLLLQELHHKMQCESLSDVEVMDACLMRGLPADLPPANMRRCLTNHLIMIAALRNHLSLENRNSQDLGLLTIHLPMIRHVLRAMALQEELAHAAPLVKDDDQDVVNM